VQSRGVFLHGRVRADPSRIVQSNASGGCEQILSILWADLGGTCPQWSEAILWLALHSGNAMFERPLRRVAAIDCSPSWSLLSARSSPSCHRLKVSQEKPVKIVIFSSWCLYGLFLCREKVGVVRHQPAFVLAPISGVYPFIIFGAQGD